MKYTQETAINSLRRNKVEVKGNKISKATIKGIKSWGIVDYLTGNHNYIITN